MIPVSGGVPVPLEMGNQSFVCQTGARASRAHSLTILSLPPWSLPSTITVSICLLDYFILTATPYVEKAVVIFVLGGPGAGKGTQCTLLAQHYPGLVHLSAGDLLRAERQRPGSQYGDLINTCIAEGRIVPMHITIGLLERAMAASGAGRFLIDGFPRDVAQGVEFERRVLVSFVLNAYSIDLRVESYAVL